MDMTSHPRPSAAQPAVSDDPLADRLAPPDHLRAALTDPSLPPQIISADDLASGDYAPMYLAGAHFTKTGLSLPVVASCPHAGRDYPEPMLDLARCSIDDLRGLEDFGVNYLLPDFTDRGIACVTSNLARAYLDVNRPVDALDAEMFTPPPSSAQTFAPTFAPPSRHVQAGYGIMPRLTAGRQPIYKTRLPFAAIDQRIAALHTPYHQMLQDQLDACVSAHRRALLIDFHSMPRRDRSRKTLPDIILGNCFGTTLDKPIGDAIARFFEGKGLDVAWNHPYAGGYITRNNGRIRSNRQSVQIEINRGLYMSDGAPNGGPRLILEKTAHIAAIMGEFADYLGHMHADDQLDFG